MLIAVFYFTITAISAHDPTAAELHLATRDPLIFERMLSGAGRTTCCDCCGDCGYCCGSCTVCPFCGRCASCGSRMDGCGCPIPAPTPAPRMFSCHISTHKCIEDPSGDFSTLVLCQKACSLPTPPPTPAPPKPTPAAPTPAGQTDLYDFIQHYGPLTNFSVLCGLAGQCKAKLSSADLTTVFAPTNTGFSQHLNASLWQQLLVPANSQLRDGILLRHLVSSIYLAALNRYVYVVLNCGSM
jgi:hypothetical protein